ncbi:hypothetical protein [Pseudonocardia spinosispora]|uniref:hypothetical protein n=1 Tax=Pseudonocardia spinosispora TaxID=103441 RepID=UPI0003FEB60C|nr:hypothetical protein [Pseudonocardia spinosispora]
MSERRTNGIGILIPGFPRQRDRESLEYGADAVEVWLDAVGASDEPPALDDDADDLRRISELALSGACEAEVTDAVRAARASGWGWAPIARLLGETRDEARQRLG